MSEFDPATHFRLYDHGPVFPYFYHGFNCGFASYPRLTERTVELAVADRWLLSLAERKRPIFEVGAVTPYYFPGRVANVVDPSDKMASDKRSLFDVDFENADVLCLSTVEHIGEGRYGFKEKRTPFDAVKHISKTAINFLITFPCGWKHPPAAELETLAIEGDSWFRENDVKVRLLTRGDDERWRPTRDDVRPYGRHPKNWANTVVFLERGNIL